MSFMRCEAPTEEDFYKALIKEPQDVEIIDIGKLYDVENKPEQKYFYIKYKLCKTGQEQSVAYNVKYNKGIITATEGSKLFPLVSFASGILDGEIHCEKSDIDDALQGRTLIMRAEKQTGKFSWYKLIPLKESQRGVESAI